MSKGEQPRALRQFLQKSVPATSKPGRSVDKQDQELEEHGRLMPHDLENRGPTAFPERAVHLAYGVGVCEANTRRPMSIFISTIGFHHALSHSDVPAVTTEFLMDDAHMRDWYYWTIIANSRRALDTILGDVSQYSVGAT
jgi:hypothetical protein